MGGEVEERESYMGMLAFGPVTRTQEIVDEGSCSGAGPIHSRTANLAHMGVS